MKITVKALTNVMGMVRGQEYRLEASDTVDALIDVGYVQWLQPEPAEETVVLTPEVKKRAPKLKAADPVPDPVVDEIADQALTDLIQLSEDLGLYEEVDSGALPEASTEES